MGIDGVAKNLLINRMCENCTRKQNETDCLTWWGESIGWQWNKKKGTCKEWSDNDNPYHVKKA